VTGHQEDAHVNWPWGRWWLTFRAGVNPDDRAAVRDRYESVRGWAHARGTARDMRDLQTLVDAITEVYGGFPGDWAAPSPQTCRKHPRYRIT
jgi:hypothetical protein